MICVEHPLHLNIMDTFLYRCFFSFLSIATPASSHAIPLLALFEHHSIYNLPPQEKFISRYRVVEFFSDSFAKIFCLSLSLHWSFTVCYICQVTLLLLRPHKCCSNIIQWLFQLHSPTSHARITALTYEDVSLFHRSSYIQTHNSIPAFYHLSCALSFPSLPAKFHLSISIGCTIRYTRAKSTINLI